LGLRQQAKGFDIYENEQKLIVRPVWPTQNADGNILV
jgi:hypothetical protein